jgi:hypothetical protein
MTLAFVLFAGVILFQGDILALNRSGEGRAAFLPPKHTER